MQPTTRRVELQGSAGLGRAIVDPHERIESTVRGGAQALEGQGDLVAYGAIRRWRARIIHRRPRPFLRRRAGPGVFQDG
jgi:hypothetical protein